MNARLLLVVVSFLAAGRVQAGDPKVPPEKRPPVAAPLPPILPPVPSPGDHPGRDVNPGGPRAERKPPAANADSAALLARLGWKAIENDAVISLKGRKGGYVPGVYLERASIVWKDGVLTYKDAAPVEERLLPGTLKGLSAFAAAGTPPLDETGRILAAWGVPPAVDGRKTVDPDGKATFYGQMLRWAYEPNPDAVKRASVQRFSQAFDKLAKAHSQAFAEQNPDVALVTLDEARKLLLLPARLGEVPLELKPYQPLGDALSGERGKIEADIADARRLGDEGRRKDSEAALATLNQLERQRYYKTLSLPAVPAPGETPRREPGGLGAKDDAPSGYAPLASGLPGLLRVLDRINGTPLTPSQQENLIKSFPMGELVWQMGAQNLWRQGITGKGVDVAVIDGGIAPQKELDGSVVSRQNFTASHGTALNDDHGTHVAGIIHALAPDARIHGYAVFDATRDPSMKENPEPLIRRAIEKAVADGNKVINLSLGGNSSPSEEMSRLIESYADKGVIFLVAAGNSRNYSGGVSAPAVAPNAITVGALDTAGRMADFSTYGDNFDARKLSYVVKTVFMAPGVNVYSTMPKGMAFEADPPPAYGTMSGTSMATPALSGVSALLTQAAGNANPVALSGRIRDALTAGSTPMSLETLPPNVPLDQDFLVVNPLAALDALRRQSAPVMASAGP